MTTLPEQIMALRNAIDAMPTADGNQCLSLSETLKRLTTYYPSTVGQNALWLAFLETKLANEVTS